MKTPSFLFMSIVLAVTTACGGGGGGSSDNAAATGTTSTPTPVTQTPSNDTPPPNEPPSTSADAETTKDLVIDAGFDMQSSREITLDFDLNTDGFLSVCSNFKRTSDNYDIDFGSCVIRAPVTQGTYQNTLSISNAVEDLIAVVYQFDETAEPLYQEFNVADGGDRYTWR